MKKILSAAFAMTCYSVYAQQTEINLDPVTITAGLTPQKISKTGRNIIVIAGSRFEKLPVHSVDELIRYLPGIEVQMRGTGGSQSDFIIRGGTFQQTLVILDGLRLNDPTSGHFSGYFPIDPFGIERVEILKGPSSAIYGGEAVGGVINIITKTFSAKRNQPQKHVLAAVSTGAFGFLQAEAGGNWQNNNTALSAGFLSNSATGQPQRGIDGFFHNHTGTVALKKMINDQWNLSVRSSYDERRFAAQNFYTAFVSDTATEKVSSYWNQLNFTYQKAQHKVSFDGGYKFVKDNYQYNFRSTANNNRSQLLQFNLTDQYGWAKRHLVSGLQFKRKKILSNDRGDHALNELAGFVVLHQEINRFLLSPSVRVDHNNVRGTELIPQLNISYVRPVLQLRGSIGKGIRDADFTERYNNYNKSLVTGGNIGNPFLESEHSFNYEVGIDITAIHAFKISSSFFRRQQHGVIDWVPTAYSNMPRKENLTATGSYSLAENIASLTVTGAELDVQYSKIFQGDQQLQISSGTVWLPESKSSTGYSFYISSHARVLTNLLVQYQVKNFSVSIAAVYKNRQSISSPALHLTTDKDLFAMNAKASLSILKRKLSLYTEADNIFDAVVYDLPGAALPGRWITAGVRFSL
jgi:vitamin B12 transporter